MTKTSKILKGLKLIEMVYPYVFSSFFVFIIYKYIPDEILFKILSIRIVDSVMTISGILFGFLITILTLLLQTSSSRVIEIKKAKRFGELISYNQQAVYNTVLVMFMSLILLFVIDDKNYSSVTIYWQFKLLLYFWVLSVFSMFFNTYRYTRIFYKIINY